MDNRDLQNKENKIFFTQKIEQAIEKYEKIILFNCRDKQIAKLAEDFCRNISCKNLTRKILVMSNAGFPDEKITDYKQLSEEEYNHLYKLYSMYEFSDRVQIITEESQYGSLQNYVKTGLLTEEEMFEALLYERK